MTVSRTGRPALQGVWSQRFRPQGFWSDESGATAIEYAGLLGILGVVILTSVTLLGKNIGKVFDAITAAFTGMGF